MFFCGVFVFFIEGWWMFLCSTGGSALRQQQTKDAKKTLILLLYNFLFFLLEWQYETLSCVQNVRNVSMSHVLWWSMKSVDFDLIKWGFLSAVTVSHTASDLQHDTSACSSLCCWISVRDSKVFSCVWPHPAAAA